MPSRGEAGRAAPVTSTEVTSALLLAHAPVVIGRIDVDERVLSLEGALLGPLGYRREDWVGRSLGDLLPDATTLSLLRRALAGEAVAERVTLNGRPWLVTGRPVVAEDGGVSGAVTVLTFADEGDVQRALTSKESLNEQFVALIELSKDFIAVADLEGTVTYLNQAGRRLVGLETDEESLGRPTADYFTAEGLARSQDIEEAVRATGSWEGESFLQHFRTGESIPVSVNSFLVTRSDGQPLALATVQRDLRGRAAVENAMTLRVQEQRAVAELGRLALTRPLAELLEEAVRLVAARYRTLVAGVMHSVAGGTSAQLVASSDPTLTGATIEVGDDTLAGRVLRRNAIVVADDLLSEGWSVSQAPTLQFGARGVLGCPIPGADRPWGVIGALSREPRHWNEDDVAFVESVASTLGAAVARDELETRLQHQALHDPLTGLPNRALVLDRVDHALARSARTGSMLAVLLLDIDDFKSVNDGLGHGSGDEMLSELAGRLTGVVRDGDTVARLGGDEFVVVCEDVATDEEVAFVTEALLEACGHTVEVGGHRLSLSASIGVALSVGGEGSTAAMLSEADMAMYRAKRDRPGTYRVFDEAMRGDVLGRINLAGDLRAAVRKDGLELAYQPIVDLASGRVIAAEALARWTDDSGRSIPPDVFIPVAEETGLIGELGALVLRRAVQQAVAWQDVAGVGVRVNASAHELRSRTYLEQVMSTLEEGGLPASLLGLEITESVYVDEDKTTQDNLSRLRDAGVTLLIDDFGTGYSSLSYLQRFPVVDVLKIDRSFLGEGTRGEAVIEAVVGLGRAFGLQVCAEGVETPAQHARVAELGCDFAQGYLLARPVPSSQVRALLAGWRPVLPPDGSGDPGATQP